MSESLRNITRMEYLKPQRTVGWWVRVVVGNKTHSKFFSDGRNGGKRNALKAAKAHRDKLWEELYGMSPPKNGRKVHHGLGVARIKRGQRTTGWRVTWCPQEHKQSRRDFMNAEYGGGRAAEAAARAFRMEKEHEVLGGK